MSKNKTASKEIDNLTSKAEILYKKGDYNGALKIYNDLIKINPNDLDSMSMIADIMLKIGQIDTASNLLEYLLKIDDKHISGLEAMAQLCDVKGNVKGAIGAYLRLAELNPNESKYFCEAGVRYKSLSDFTRAIENLEKALSKNPQNVRALKEICPLLYIKGNYEVLRAYYKKLYKLSPSYALKIAIATLVPAVFKTSAEIEEWRKKYAEELDKLLAMNPKMELGELEYIRTPFHLIYHNKNNKELNIKLAKIYEKAFSILKFTAPHCLQDNKKEVGKKIRIGFISKYFYDHSVNNAFGKLIELLDKNNEFEVFVISTLETKPQNNLWNYFENKGRAVQIIYNIGSAQNQIANLQLDILVYTELGMDLASYCLAFARLAKVQCLLMGHPETSGISNMDYYITGKILEPDNAQEYFSEKLILMNSKPYFTSRIELPKHIKNREELGLSVNKNIYMVPFKLQKVHPDFDEILNRIMAKDANAEIVLFIDYGNISDLLKARFDDNIKPEFKSRIKFFPWANKEDFFGFLKSADVIIDSFYFGVGTTMYFIASIGTPVVTMPKGYFRGGRMAQAFYNEAGLNELIAKDVDAYIDLAVRIANDKEYRKNLEEKILAKKDLIFENQGTVEEFTEIFKNLGLGKKDYLFNGGSGGI